MNDSKTHIDPSESRGLKHNITLLSELNELETINILKAKSWVRSSRIIKKDFPSESSLRLLHEKMFGQVWDWAGQYRSTEKNIGRFQASQVPEAMKVLCDDIRYRAELGQEELQYLAVIFHHRITDIHPFPNGNGRFARECANILLKQKNKEEFSWGLNLKEISQARDRYISALRAADRGQYDELLEFVRT